jgi:uncharacterized alkaline shock family protein YloU
MQPAGQDPEQSERSTFRDGREAHEGSASTFETTFGVVRSPLDPVIMWVAIMRSACGTDGSAHLSQEGDAGVSPRSKRKTSNNSGSIETTLAGQSDPDAEVHRREIMMTIANETELQTAASNSNAMVPRARATELVTPEGRTTIADVVVSKIAGLAAKEVPGVHELVGQGMGAAVSGLAQRVGRADTRSTGVNVEVGEREAAVDLRLTVEYGVSIPELATAVRGNVMDRLQSMTGLRVKEVNIDVVDLYFAEEATQTTERRVE